MYRTFYYVFGLAANDDDDGAEKVSEPAKLSVYFDGSTRKVGESSKCKTQQTNQNPSDDYTFCLYPCKFMTKRRSRKHKHKHNHYGSLESTAFFRSPTRPTKCIAKRTSSREPHSQHTHTLALVHTSTERKETYGILWANENNKPNIKYPCEHVHTKHRKHTAEWEKNRVTSENPLCIFFVLLFEILCFYPHWQWDACVACIRHHAIYFQIFFCLFEF